MLRLPPFRYHRPDTVAHAVGVMGEHAGEEIARRAHEQCRPLDNMIVDHEWRRARVGVYVRRALEKLSAA